MHLRRLPLTTALLCRQRCTRQNYTKCSIRILHSSLLQLNDTSPFLALLDKCLTEEMAHSQSQVQQSSSSSSSSSLQCEVSCSQEQLAKSINCENKENSTNHYEEHQNCESNNVTNSEKIESFVNNFVTIPLQNCTMQQTKGMSDDSNNSDKNVTNNVHCNTESKQHTNPSHDRHEVPSAQYKTFSQTSADDNYKVFISDRFGMPAELPRNAPQSFEELAAMCPTHLQDALQTLRSNKNWSKLTSVQRATIPFILEHRDVLCVAPTATGKTFAYVFPTMLRLTLDAIHGSDTREFHSSINNSNKRTSNSTDVSKANLNGRDVERLIQDKINKGEICRYCELSLRENRLCPMTGVPHPPPSLSRYGTRSSSNNNNNNNNDEDEDDITANLQLPDQRKPMWLHEINTVASPKVLVLVPTSPLVHQTFHYFMSLRGEFNIRYLLRAKTKEEQEHYLRALQNPDVLISTPETILAPLLKHKLTLREVKTVIFDEVDLLVSLNHFDAIKMILSNLPKAHTRSQRLCFAASLPVPAYEGIRDNMLLTSHRFILADANVKQMNAREFMQTNAQQLLPPSSSSSSSMTSLITDAMPATNALVNNLLTASPQLTHVVYMLGRAEKVSKLIWMFKSGVLTRDQRVLIFCNSRYNVAYLHEQLQSHIRNIHFTTLTAQAGQQARVGVLKMFTSGVSTCLICTDMLSRGVDVANVIYVVNYDTPSEMDTWVHRCGRCGRNGLQGYCYTFFQPENIKLAKPLVAHLRRNKQVVPPKLAEYAKQSFEDLFTHSLFHSPTRPRRRDDPQNTTHILGQATPRYPDYRQSKLQKHIRPL